MKFLPILAMHGHIGGRGLLLLLLFLAFVSFVIFISCWPNKPETK